MSESAIVLLREIAGEQRRMSQQLSEIIERMEKRWQAPGGHRDSARIVHGVIKRNGIDYAKNILMETFGTDRADEIIAPIINKLQVKPYSFIQKIPPERVLAVMREEHPQTIALIMCYMEPEQSAKLLPELPYEIRADVAKRVATMDSASPDILREVERVLERKLSGLVHDDYQARGGVVALAAILDKLDDEGREAMIAQLEATDEELARKLERHPPA